MPKIFLSHSHHDRELAGEIKAELQLFGADVFVAHEDIKPTQEWQEAIMQYLKECEAFVALLTDRFEDSDWTDQETGIALALEKIIIPIKLDLDPYGFISKYQALKWDLEDPENTFSKLVKLLLDRKVLNIDNVIEGFAKSYSFKNAKANSELLNELGAFSKPQIDKIVSAALENRQIRDSYGAKPVLWELIAKYTSIVNPELMRQWNELRNVYDEDSSFEETP